MSDEPTTAYRRVRTMEGWAPLDDLSTEMLPACSPTRGVRVIYNHTRREYVSGAPWPRAASVDDKNNPPAARWLRDLRDRLWTSKDTGYQVLDVVIHYALMDGADSEQRTMLEINEGLRSDVANREAALRRAVELVRTVWDHSGEGTTALADYVEGHDGDANHWSGVMRWVHGVEDQEGELIERVARWACDTCYSHGSFERMAEAPRQRQAWLDGARRAIKGDK